VALLIPFDFLERLMVSLVFTHCRDYYPRCQEFVVGTAPLLGVSRTAALAALARV
jgi:hypothetical protein